MTPGEPVVISSRELTGTPNTPIEIVTEPTYGTAEVVDRTTLVYTSLLTDPKSTVVDVVEYQYTNLRGTAVIDRKEFILKQAGDVPRIIQTGEIDNGVQGTNLWILLIIIGLLVFALRFLWARRENE